MGRFQSTSRITHIADYSSFTGNIYGLNTASATFSPTGIIDVNTSKQQDCTCVSSVDPIDALTALLNFLEQLYTTITRITTNVNVNAPFSTFISISGAMKFSLHTRILWTKFNPGVQFNPEDITHINGLKDIYLSANRDWHSDTFIVTQSQFLEQMLELNTV